MRIGILDLKINNLFSIRKVFEVCGYKTILVTKNLINQNIDMLVLPGVGSFRHAMEIMNAKKINEEIINFSEKKSKFLYGICLGMQLFFNESEEFGNTKGLSLIKGKVKKFDKKLVGLVPNIGWNQVSVYNKINKKINNIDKKYFYFVHSYYCKPDNNNDIFLNTSYGDKNFKFCSAVIKNNIIGTQFHPEKSGNEGINFIKNFIKKL
jgi:imidazole glycerol-phosphate synthase subunit HisH